jgi:serine/threonine-protein kinase
MTQTQAQTAIQAAGLSSTVTMQNDINQPALHLKVASSNPAAGQIVNAGTTVALTVYKENGVAVPNTVGMTQTQAQAALQAAGLNSTVAMQDVLKHPELHGKVAAQNPAAGQFVNAGSAVGLKVYKNQFGKQVPSTNNGKLSGYKQVLSSSGFTNVAQSKTSSGCSSFQKNYKIVKTVNPSPGTWVLANARITVYYCGN